MSRIAREVINVNIEDEMKTAYMTYAMSVIVGRALPDVRDGFKPVHRRILYSMFDQGLTPDRRYSKCAATVGEVLKKYHPHGDSAVYDAMVRMAQDFSLRYPLVDGQGNFGSVDGDPPAAYRYTEARLAALAMELLADIEKETVDFGPNFDETVQEPLVLPARVPNLLVNGSAGIAVGMATNIPPHNLSEVCEAAILLVDDPEAGLEQIMKVLPGPDFPTAGLILGTSGIRSAYETGRGSITLQSRVVIEPMEGGRDAILITELPYQVNKAELIEAIAGLARDKRLEGLSEIRDESDRSGMRIVIELRRDTNPNVVLNYLYKHTSMRTTFGIIMLSLVGGQPRVLNIKEMLQYFLEHRREVITRRTQFDLERAKARAHILEGLRIIVQNIEEVVRLIRTSSNREEAKSKLKSRFQLSEEQAQAVIVMQLGQLTQLDQKKIEDEYRELLKQIEYLEGILADKRKVQFLIKQELQKLKKDYGDERRTAIKASEARDISIEDLIAEEDMIITITRDSYIKRLPVDTYRTQQRGGRGVLALTKKEQDSVEHLFVATTLHYILFFTNKGRIYQIKAYEVPPASRQARGTPVINLIQVEPGETVTATISVPGFDRGGYLFMTTKRGVVKKTALEEFDTRLKKGIIAINLQDDDELNWVKWTDGTQDILLGTRFGMAVHFSEKDVRSMGRQAAGVTGVRFKKPGDYVVGMDVAPKGKEVLVVSELGYGKRTPVNDYRFTARGAHGVITMNITEKNGPVVDLRVVDPEDELLMITQNGVMIRQPMDAIRETGRSAQGVRLIRLEKADRVSTVARIVREEEE